MRRLIAILLFIIIFIAVVSFSALNPTPTTIHYYIVSLTVPLSIIVITSLISGLIIGTAITFSKIVTLRYENRQLKKKLTASEQEVNNLRILPLKNGH